MKLTKAQLRPGRLLRPNAPARRVPMRPLEVDAADDRGGGAVALAHVRDGEGVHGSGGGQGLGLVDFDVEDCVRGCAGLVDLAKESEGFCLR